MSTDEREAFSAVAELREFIKRQDDGAVLDWVSVERESHIAMDPSGRSMLRKACHLERRPYENIKGRLGIRLSSADNACTFSRNRSESVARSAARAVKYVRRLFSRHEDELKDGAKQALLRDISTHASIRQAAMYSVPLPAPLEPKPDPDERLRYALRRMPKG